MSRLTRGCGCLTVVVALVLALPLMVVIGASSSSAAGPPEAVAGHMPNAAPQGIPWRPLFGWTPPTGEPVPPGWPWGQCTWFVVTQGHAGGDHQVHWSGDAWQWYGNAQAAGYPTQPPSVTPQIGWIAVYARGHGADATAGHVAVVVAVTATTYTVAEAHVLGLGVVDERTLALPSTGASQPLVEGWIP